MKAQIREIARRHCGTMTDAQYLSMVYALEELDRKKDEEYMRAMETIETLYAISDDPDEIISAYNSIKNSVIRLKRF